MPITGGNLFADLPSPSADEHVTQLFSASDLRVERIISAGHASPPGFWYDQEWAEWVIVLAGSAGLRFADEGAPRVLKPGDYLHIPARRRHRVEWTDPNQTTIWLAIHYRANEN
jgi:cupin 2 domain-containing protein